MKQGAGLRSAGSIGAMKPSASKAVNVCSCASTDARVGEGPAWRSALPNIAPAIQPWIEK